MSELVRMRLPSGQEIWARVSSADRGPSDVGFRKVIPAVEGLAETIQGVAESVQRGLVRVRPDTVTVEFGLELSVSAGKIVSVLTDAGAKATVKVALGWSKSTPRGGAAADGEDGDDAEESDDAGEDGPAEG
ncbi:CU044_2847 family protein [Actinoalloteichus spitiensis]|uniref:CU044_2847 family protein n=1 Tax=Actinoalloteichus spitiensis TaxID=252394 RepID=UPI00030DCAFC|nr:CU044_2847 family protein [Actinoalloteichus spitiensis]